MLFKKDRNAIFGRYPSCDLLNNALRFLKDGKIDDAISEIIFAIDKAGGYYHDDLVPFIREKSYEWRLSHRKTHIE